MHRKYFSISADDPIWLKLSHELRGKDFKVPYSWREGSFLNFRDWRLLVKKKLTGKIIYVQKTKRINYKNITA